MELTFENYQTFYADWIIRPQQYRFLRLGQSFVNTFREDLNSKFCKSDWPELFYAFNTGASIIIPKFLIYIWGNSIIKSLLKYHLGFCIKCHNPIDIDIHLGYFECCGIRHCYNYDILLNLYPNYREDLKVMYRPTTIKGYLHINFIMGALSPLHGTAVGLPQFGIPVGDLAQEITLFAKLNDGDKLY
jgi:hypothetical protein